jgi:protein gp37
MADLFGRWVPREWIEAVLQVVADNSQWNFLFLTKFPIRLAEFDFPANAWLGTTVDAQARVANAERAFSKVRGGVKWLSCEPLLEPLRFNSLEMFDWVVIGGASSSTQTPEFHPPRAWVESLEAQARRAGCKVYEKTNLLERIREYPGQADAAPVNVPDAFKMTYLQRDVLTPIEYQQELAV